MARADVAILSGDLDDRYADAPQMRWIHCDHAGLNKSARPWVFERGLHVTSSSGRSAPALAEHAFLFMLLFSYRYLSFLEAQRQHRWGFEGQDQLRGLIGKTIGIVGLGNTGRELATRAQAMGMRVLGYRRSAEDVPGLDRLYARARGDSLDDLLRVGDFVGAGDAPLRRDSSPDWRPRARVDEAVSRAGQYGARGRHRRGSADRHHAGRADRRGRPRYLRARAPARR